MPFMPQTQPLFLTRDTAAVFGECLSSQWDLVNAESVRNVCTVRWKGAIRALPTATGRLEEDIYTATLTAPDERLRLCPIS